MIPPPVVAAFFAGVFAAAALVVVADRRAIRAEERFWADLADEAITGYGRVFDWQEEGL